MRASPCRAWSVALLAALSVALVAGDARADFLILKNGKSFGGTLTEYADGSAGTSESEFRHPRESIARTSTKQTVDEVIATWSAEIGECKTAASREACLSLAKFCAAQQRYKEASKYFTLWGKPRKWKVYSSKYYFILSDAKAKRVKEIGVRLDAIMRFFQKEFGEERELKQDFVVRFFRYERQFDAFASEAGMGGAGAFYDPTVRELVLWDMSATNKNFTFESVYHEANHQYVGDSYLDHEPEHAWFAEGLATYYETAKCRGKRIIDHGKKSRTYLTALNQGDRAGKLTPLSTFLSMDQSGFYGDADQEAVNYAQAWALVYFFKNTKDKACRAFFERYVEVLKKSKDDAQALAEALDVAGYEELEKAFAAFRKRL